MKAHRRNRLIAILAGVLSLGGAVGLVVYALDENMDHFYTPTQLSEQKISIEQSVRVGGLVVDGSLKRATDSLEILFDVTDTAETVTVKYDGILPDLFREGQGIIATGKWNGNQLVASQVLAKHDETYMPPEVKEAIEKAGHPKQVSQ